VFELCADEVAAGGYDAVDGVNLGGGRDLVGLGCEWWLWFRFFMDAWMNDLRSIV